jgi:hypothetical protein
MTKSTTRGCARFVGRVGALAVALGIGAALASSPGIAWADSGESDSSGASTSAPSNDASTKGPSTTTPSGTKSGEPASGEAKPTHSTAEQQSADADDPAESTVTDDETPTEPTAGATPKPTATDDEKDAKPSKPRKHVEADTSARTAVAEQQSPAKSESESRTLTAAQPKAPAPAADDAQAPAPTTSFAKVAAVQSFSAQSDEPDVPAAQPDPPGGVVTEVVSSLLSAVGLNPLATGGLPTTPPQSPTLWTMLGWVRRELGHVFAPATAGTASAVATTSLVQPTESLVQPSLVATSVLGTQQQLTAEQIATRTLNTLPMQLMKLVLRFGFMSAAQQQFGPEGPDQANIDQLDEAVNEYAMGAAFQQQILDSMNPTVVTQVAPPHTWYDQVVPGSRILYDNPDTIYRFMGVNGASSYVITGRFDGDMPADTTFSVLTGLTGNTAFVLTKDQLKLNSDGHSFTITADSTSADGRDNHLQLTADTTLIATRNTLSDWANQHPMSLEITRVGGPPPSLFSQLGGFAIPGLGPLVVNNPLLTALVSLVPPLPFTPPLLRGTVAAVIMALGIQREAQYMAVATTDPTTGQRIEPNVLKDPTRNAEFLATQLQSAGYFQLADDEALVLTIDPGDAKYFVVPVTNDWTITDDYWNEQTSLNNVQATPVGGVYTIVISPTDPLVKNWVSTGGLNQGTISIRFQDLPLDPTHLPTVDSQVVKLDELASVLPAGTLYVTPDEREALLAVRKAGFDNRFAPYPQP